MRKRAFVPLPPVRDDIVTPRDMFFNFNNQTDKGTPECLNGTWTCYTFVRLQKTWQQAKEFCEERGAVLAGPDSRETANAIYQKAKQYVLNSNAFYWLGASDRVTNDEPPDKPTDKQSGI